MSRFASTKLREIDLGDGDIIKIPVALSYKQVLALTSHETEAEISKAMLMECIREWNLKDDDGNDVPVTEENIMNLKIDVIQIVTNELLPLLDNKQDKKK